MRKSTLTDFVQVTKGGNNQGTWMHEDVAMEFARWLSPAFAIWCNDRIKELLTQGVTTIANDDETIANAMIILQKRLEASKQQLQIAESERDTYKEEVKQLAPKAQYTDEVLQSTSTYTFTQVAKELGFQSAIKFTQLLMDKKILFRQSGQYQLSARFAGNGYTATRTARFFRNDGSPDCSLSTVWTEKGRQFLHCYLTKIAVL